MDRVSHQWLGGVAGLAYGVGFSVAWWQLPIAAAAGALSAGGATSPDMDQYGPWKATDRRVPDECLGHGGPMQHRGLTHWWGIPLLAALFLIAAQKAGTVDAPWLWWSLITGWTSHLIGDWLFGMASKRCHRGPGIPLAPWWNHHGLGLRSGGKIEHICRWVVVAPTLVALVLVRFELGWVVPLVGRHVGAASLIVLKYVLGQVFAP